MSFKSSKHNSTMTNSKPLWLKLVPNFIRIRLLHRTNFLSVLHNDTLIVTNEEHRFLVLDQLREMKNIKAQLLLEPIGRNTAPALTLAALQATEKGEDPIFSRKVYTRDLFGKD